MHSLDLGLITLFFVSIIIFSAIAMLPGDFVKARLGRSATPETVATFQREIGIERPLVERYIAWIGQIVQGDFGSSLASRTGYRRTVGEIIALRLYNTMFLAVMTPLSRSTNAGARHSRRSPPQRLVLPPSEHEVTLTTISFLEFFVANMLAYLIISRDTFVGTEFAQSPPKWFAASIN